MTNEGSGDFADATLRDFTPGQKLFGRYTLIKILGRGGMFNSLESYLGRTVTVQVL